VDNQSKTDSDFLHSVVRRQYVSEVKRIISDTGFNDPNDASKTIKIDWTDE
jgi:hypothetical protein